MRLGYLGGACRVNEFECHRRDEVKQPDMSRLCPYSQRYDTCCCIAEYSVNASSFFVYNKGAYDGSPQGRGEVAG